MEEWTAKLQWTERVSYWVIGDRERVVNLGITG